MQRALFERQGVAGSWGITCLGRVNSVYSNDPELLALFYSFVAKCATLFVVGPVHNYILLRLLRRDIASRCSITAQGTCHCQGYREQQQRHADLVCARTEAALPAHGFAFVCRDEAATDEAEMPTEQFQQKQAFMQQMQAQVRIFRPTSGCRLPLLTWTPFRSLYRPAQQV